MTAPVSTSADLAEKFVLENDGMPIGHRPPGKLNTAGWVICLTPVALTFIWIVMGIVGGFIPDHLEPAWFDAVTEPLADFAALVGGY